MKNSLLVLLFFTSTLYAQESINPPSSITSFGIAMKVLSKLYTNSHYKLIGTCTWAVPPKLVEVPAVEQFLPDLIVTVSNRPETNPWIEAKLLYENALSRAVYQRTFTLATGFPLDFGDDAGVITIMHINDERTRVVNVIGGLAGFYQFPGLSHGAETQLGFPYYISEADALIDRTEIAELVYMATHPQLLINHDIGGNGQVWGHEIPRLMRVTHPSRFRASVVAAIHAADIVTNKNGLHITQSTKNACGENCVVSNVIYDEHQKNSIWQEVYPHNRNIHFSEEEALGIADDTAGNGNYIFVIWRKYRGCVKHPGTLIKALSFPKVGQPQKR